MRHILATLSLVACSQAWAQTVTFTEIASGFENATDLQFAPGSGAAYVTEQNGLVRMIEGNSPRSSPVLDIRDRVANVGESGLLSLAFDPQWPADPYIYLHYTRPISGGPSLYQAVFARYQVNTTTHVADVGSEQVLLRIDKPNDGPDRPGNGHQGGSIVFGNDGYLYLTVGEAQQRQYAQDMTSLLGKVLRIDVNGGGSPLDCGAGTGSATIPPGNPHAGGPGGDCDEIFARGFRNPWRMSFDPPSGQFWIGDVGEALWEEVDVLSAGGDYGWPIMEGNHCTDTNPGCDPSPFVLPAWEYDRSQGGAITGGYVYRGSGIDWLQGKYVYGDFVSGRVWAYTPGTSTNQLIGSRPGSLMTSFGRDGAGALYMLELGGRVHRLDGGTVAAGDAPAPADDALALTGPNPVGAGSTLSVVAAIAGPARITLHDTLGRTVATLFEGTLSAGARRLLPVATSRLAPGVYVACLTTDGGTESVRLTVAR